MDQKQEDKNSGRTQKNLKMINCIPFPERRFVAGFFRRLLAYLTPHIPHISHTTHILHISITPHISHTYPFKTYPTNTYPTNAYPFKTFASAGLQYVSQQYVSVQHVSHQYVSMLCVSIQCVSIQKVCISRNRKRIPPIHIPPIRISVRILCVSIQCVSIQKVCISRNRKRIPPIHIPPIRIFNMYPTSTDPMRIHSMRIHSKSLHQQEWQWVWVSLHIISYHCYSAGMVMNIKTLLFLQFFAKLLIEYNCIARVWTWNSLLAIGLPACLPVVCFCACFLIIFYYSIPPGGMGRVNRKATLSLKTRRRSPKTVAKRKVHFLPINPLAKNVVSIAQNCSETQISFALGQPSR